MTECLGQSLLDAYIKPKKTPKLQKLKTITKDLLTALTFLKAKGVIHCDLKPENILFTNKKLEMVKLIDFGSSIFIDDAYYSYIQTRPYRAPEIVFGCQFDFSADMWSLGCILYELVTNQILFRYKHSEENVVKAMALNGLTDIRMFRDGKIWSSIMINDKFIGLIKGNKNSDWLSLFIPNMEYNFDQQLRARGCDDFLIDFIRKCLIIDPNKRMTVEEAFEHQFIKSMD